MAIRGRRPKPLRVQAAEGDPRQRGKKKLQARLKAEPSATKGLGPCPRHLHGRARGAWLFWAAELDHMGLASRPDGLLLTGACVSYARAIEMDLLLEKEGCIVEESELIGEGAAAKLVVTKRKPHPGVAISASHWRAVRLFCSEFGLSPVSRTRLAPKSPDDGQAASDELARLLSTPRKPFVMRPLQ